MKTIILACPKTDDSIDYHIEKNLREHGYNVVSLAFPYNDFKYKNIRERIINFIRKTILGDKNYKNRLKFKRFEKELKTRLSLIESANYAIVIRSDIYPRDFIKEIKDKSEKIYSYHWDGLEVYSEAKKHIDLYDKFYVFDPNDMKYKAEYPNLYGLTNFYFESECKNLLNPKQNIKDKTIFYLGTYKKDRYEDLVQIYNS